MVDTRRRKSTVHDVAALRIHRDGTRVPNSDANLRPRQGRYATRNARGDWTAQDAGGTGTVKQRRSTAQADDNAEGEHIPLDDDLPPSETGTRTRTPSPAKSVSNSKGKGRARDDDDAGVSRRAEKRRRFDADLDFLGPAAQSQLPGAASSVAGAASDALSSQGQGTLPVPSSDLLKSLHYFAASYYTSMGQLYDASREARAEKKARRLQRAQAVAGSSRAQSEVTQGDEAEHSSSSESDASGPSEGETRVKKRKGRSRSQRKRRGKEQPIDKDMYKIFDGSALMVLGMLFQEHTARLLTPQARPEWEQDQMAAEEAEIAAERRIKRVGAPRKAHKQEPRADEMPMQDAH